jgi:hypothetical protein
MVRFPVGLHINAGSWTYGDATYVVYDDEAFSVRSWPDGKTFGDEQYRGILGANSSKSFFDWWNAFYRGWFRYDIDGMNKAVMGE